MIAIIEKSKDEFIVKLYNEIGLVENYEVSNVYMLKEDNSVIGIDNLITTVKN
jgi:hypothetical protein